MSYQGLHFQIDFDFIAHLLRIETTVGSSEKIALRPSAPEHPGTPYGARFVDIEAYSHEVSSCGFWPGGGHINEPVFYAYAYPEPQGFKDYPIQPSEAFYHTGMGEFLLPYDVVRMSESPDDVLLSFLQSTYEAAATGANWDRHALERQ
jgi:hypothetical protein